MHGCDADARRARHQATRVSIADDATSEQRYAMYEPGSRARRRLVAAVQGTKGSSRAQHLLYNTRKLYATSTQLQEDR